MLPPQPPLVYWDADPEWCIPPHPFQICASFLIVAISTMVFYWLRWFRGFEFEKWRRGEPWHTDPFVLEKHESNKKEYEGIKMWDLPFVSISEAWALPESRIVLGFCALLVSLWVPMCFARPYVWSFVCIVANAVCAVALTSWRSFRHMSATWFLCLATIVLQTALWWAYNHYVEGGTALWITQLVLLLLFFIQPAVKWYVNDRKQMWGRTVAANLTQQALHVLEYTNFGCFVAAFFICYVPVFG